jgi:3-oxoacyl-[acyl-carrier protein] reductase|tara:strand:+ start:6311 stop:7075 length:765 start_codon:yes stop_codon:yes gene_type:complete
MKRVAVVTGGSKGIGLGIVKEFISKEINVLVIARNEELLNNLKSNYNSEQIEILIGDVSDTDLPKKALKLALSKWGRVDILVNNAGGPPANSFLNHDENAWMSAFEISLMSVIRFSTTFAPVMKNNNWGRILSITSTIAKEPSPLMVLSATMRAGVAAFNKSISTELAPYNITVNAICPGGVLTDRLVSLVRQKSLSDERPYEDVLKESENSIPIKRFASVEEIAKTANFLCSEDGSYITGVQLSVDGGLSKSY